MGQDYKTYSNSNCKFLPPLRLTKTCKECLLNTAFKMKYNGVESREAWDQGKDAKKSFSYFWTFSLSDVRNEVVCYPAKSLQILLPLSGYRRPRWMNSSKSIIFLVLPNFAWRLEKTLLVVHERKSYCRTVASQCWWWSREKVEEELFEPCFLPVSIFLKH